MIAEVSEKVVSADDLFRGIAIGGIRMTDFAGIDVEERDRPWPLIPFGFVNMAEGPLPGRSLGISGSVRSLRSVMFLSSFSDLIWRRLAHCRNGCSWWTVRYYTSVAYRELTGEALYVKQLNQMRSRSSLNSFLDLYCLDFTFLNIVWRSIGVDMTVDL